MTAFDRLAAAIDDLRGSGVDEIADVVNAWDAWKAREAEPMPADADERERLGRIVREVWIKWAKEQPSPKPSWLVPWEGLSEPDREVDRRIGERLAREGRATAPVNFPGSSDSSAPLTEAEARAWAALGEHLRDAQRLTNGTHPCDIEEQEEAIGAAIKAYETLAASRGDIPDAVRATPSEAVLLTAREAAEAMIDKGREMEVEGQRRLREVVRAERHALSARGAIPADVRPEAEPASRQAPTDAECPGEDCPMCNGEACAKCGAGTRSRFGEEPCEHDVMDRHEERHDVPTLTDDERDLVIAAIPLQTGFTRDGQRVIAAAEMAVATGEGCRSRCHGIACEKRGRHDTHGTLDGLNMWLDSVAELRPEKR